MLDEAQLVLVPLYIKHKTKFVLQQFIIEYIQIYSRGNYTNRPSFQTNGIFSEKFTTSESLLIDRT